MRHWFGKYSLLGDMKCSGPIQVKWAWIWHTEHPPGLILLDLGLPDIDGQTLVRYFRNMPELDDVPIIVVTAWPEETAKNMVTAYGCNGYIGKPVDIHLLSDTVNEYFKAA